jgi:hypothetical protein
MRGKLRNYKDALWSAGDLSLFCKTSIGTTDKHWPRARLTFDLLFSSRNIVALSWTVRKHDEVGSSEV